MNDIKELEKKLQSKTQKNIVQQIIETFNMGFEEFKNTTNKMLSLPESYKNIIPKWLDKFEDKIIKLRKPSS